MALVNLQFIQYNNYFNKILRKPANPFLVTSYNSYPVKKIILSVAFNENDGVTTYQVVDKDIDDVGDYLLVHDGEDIISHWFVTEAKRNRLGQCMVTLQRDLLVDYYETIKSAPAFIERGMLSNDDPMIFNDEGLSFNQIKQSVIPLMDNTHCSWIIGYLAKDSDLTSTDVQANVSIQSVNPDYTYSSWSEAPQILQDLISGNKYFRNQQNYKLSIKDLGYIRIQNQNQCYFIDSISCVYNGASSSYYKKLANDFVLRADGTVATGRSTLHPLRLLNIRPSDISTYAGDVINYQVPVSLDKGIRNNKDTIDTMYDFNNQETLAAIELYNGAIIQVDGTKYKIELNTYSEEIDVDLESQTTLDSSIKSSVYAQSQAFGFPLRWENSSGTILSNISNADLELVLTCQTSTLKANQIGQVASMTFPNHQNRQETLDAQYDIFAIPLPLKNFGYDGTTKFATSRLGTPYVRVQYEVSLAMAQKLAVLFGSKLYDMQILPYCPMVLGYNQRIASSIIPDDETIECRYIKVNGQTNSFVLFCSNCEFERDIWREIEKTGDAKIQKTLMKYRLSGGNYASMFDFTPDMNGGVEQFKAYCTYKPYKPFVKVNPLFNYLYGNESFKDANGLILSGDTSITIISDAWTQYLIQNKNFEAMFDRQIQTVEKTNDVTLMNSKFSAVSGTLGGTATGAVAGGMKGGLYGAIAGAVVGGVASGVGGAVDVNNQAMLMQDNLDLQRQMHAFQIDNIKALPDTIQKVTCLNVIDKVIPILEVFSCTPEEQEAFSNYIRYNGMSVGRIDKIENFESNGGFIQGRFIRLEGLSEDYHLANALNTTFQAGFYFEEV